jgi:hypothetical protein
MACPQAVLLYKCLNPLLNDNPDLIIDVIGHPNDATVSCKSPNSWLGNTLYVERLGQTPLSGGLSLLGTSGNLFPSF